MEHKRPLESIPDDELLRRLATLLHQSRRVESDLVAHIGEVDERRLYAREASPSMFAYCTEVLHLSEAEAYLRIAAARASREHPMLLTMLGDGRLHLTGIAKLAPHLTRENRDALLKRATHQSKRQIEELVAEIAPRPDAPAVMRKLPDKRPVPTRVLSLGQAEVTPSVELRLDGVGATPDPAPAAIVTPLAPARYRVQFTASSELHDKLERLRALMRSQVPDGDLAAIIEQAVTEKLERLEARRFAKSSTPRKGLAETNTAASTRHIPAAVRRAVNERDGNRCRPGRARVRPRGDGQEPAVGEPRRTTKGHALDGAVGPSARGSRSARLTRRARGHADGSPGSETTPGSGAPRRPRSGPTGTP